jgi:hypothetical protein
MLASYIAALCRHVSRELLSKYQRRILPVGSAITQNPFLIINHAAHLGLMIALVLGGEIGK